jgi:DNA-binding CsgD family transcriptional regulator
VLAAALALRGDVDRLRTVLEVADLERDQSPTLVLQLDYDHLTAFARAWTGDTDGAEATIRSVADQAQSIGYHWLHVLARASLVRLGWADERDAACAGETLGQVDAPLIQLVAELVVAAGTRDLAGLDRVADRFAAVEAGLFEVDARVTALGLVRADHPGSPAPVHGGHDPADLADLTGRRARLDQVLARCPGLRTPLASTADATSALSPREHEIASLAATGLASKQIAEQLGLSPRTVDNNLRRAYAKLGIDGRHQLATALSR